MIGTLINAGAVVAGSMIGWFLKSRMPERISEVGFQVIGLFTIFLGIYMAFKTRNFLIIIFSIIAGTIIGELLDIEKYLDRFGRFLKKKIGSDNENFSEGMITAFLLFCMGSMTVLGAIEEGLEGTYNIYLAKSTLDGFSSIALSATLGMGVVFSAIPLLIYQGGLTFLAGSVENILSDVVINEVTAVGGIIILGLGINILKIKKLRTINMLPSLLVAGILAYFML